MSDASPNRSSDRPALLVAAVALVAVVALSALVGFVGAPHNERFSWELASIFGTALGTTLLAAATGWLAWSTRSEVRATQRLAELTQEQQAANDRPVVLLEDDYWEGPPISGRLFLQLRNVGLGPALRVRVNGTYDGHEDWQPYIGTKTIPALPAGERRLLDLPANFLEDGPPDGVHETRFHVAGTYLDRSRTNEYSIITSWPED